MTVLFNYTQNVSNNFSAMHVYFISIVHFFKSFRRLLLTAVSGV